MRTSLCKEGHHGICGGIVNRGLVDRPRLDDCSCQCHKTRAAPAAAVTADVRTAAFERDGYRCMAARKAGEYTADGWPACGGLLVPHHVVQRSVAPELRDELSNILTVCAAHHTWIHDNETDARDLGLLKRSTDGAG